MPTAHPCSHRRWPVAACPSLRPDRAACKTRVCIRPRPAFPAGLALIVQDTAIVSDESRALRKAYEGGKQLRFAPPHENAIPDLRMCRQPVPRQKVCGERMPDWREDAEVSDKRNPSAGEKKPQSRDCPAVKSAAYYVCTSG